ncbi:glycoside hydrolase family 3 C-terminal domain-containing protein [Cryobacterium sp. 10S3]|uniref:beta-glucosidase n=3 Tax=Cryobacterium TaxID=69578 RepID=UPI002AC9CB0C|nr:MULTISPECIES: glycoside hydrolase family 3 C-terminal domain-containing protein [unclassified Cryobacterium]MEB0201556.1 glycoside hydrolase family 3 C-terminal domain-containing protein [Cryobacterium sp. 5I3]MEB0284989.1 glycoside hydrolase family 3 C-terminal domain-containing protein [Cryobacterium sp. 10S3]WPX14005.1 glycoside hydrolase family 3 C-terminal domain-containing protein [Cryobacterium sp. 10S3]
MTISLNEDTAVDARLVALLDQLTLEEKVLVLTGHDFWATWPLPKIGLRRILVSDGPSGVRGEVWDERSPSLNLPSSTALGASWDPAIARRYGNVAAVEARRKGVDVVLGPTINLHRSPLGGRHFECFSEDPILTAKLASAYVTGVQENGVGATPKHYIANDFETDRFTANVVVADRTLRELYLLAFEEAIVDAGAWLVMSSYNSVNGPTVTENELLETPLNSEWGFDGVVISDWTAVRSIESARHSQDLVMPGPAGPWGDTLVAAVLAGEVDEAQVDRKVLRLLGLAARVGALDGFEAAVPVPVVVEDGIRFAREAAIAGAVLVRNDGELPWAAERLTKVAVIGHNAKFARTQGGGSATVLPEHVVTPLDGLIAALPNAEVTYSVGAVVQEGIAEFPLSTIENPVTGEPGARVRFLDAAGVELFSEDRRASALVWFGGDAPIAASSVLEFTTRYTPEESGEVLIGFASVGNGRIFIDGELRHEASAEAVGTDLGAAFLSPPSVTVDLAVEAGVPIDVKIEYDVVPDFLGGALAITVGIEPDLSHPEALIEEAAAAAAAADVVVLVVGTNSKVESEGFDRTSLDLPGRQDELVRAVAAANPRTVVVVNAGSPVLMPWRNDVSAVLLSWFGGQEYGDAVAAILLGESEPGGRLPTTWPVTLEDVPVFDVTPVDGVVRYDEGIHIGYRAWLKAGTEPAYEFGHGLGYTEWTLDVLTLDRLYVAPEENGADTVAVTVGLTNTGDRAGKQVVQVYASRAESAIDRPVRWLVGFAAVHAEAGESVVASILVPARAFADWQDGWHFEPGDFRLEAGTSVSALPLGATVTVR